MWRRLMPLSFRLNRALVKSSKYNKKWFMRTISTSRNVRSNYPKKGSVCPTQTYGGRKRRGNLLLVLPFGFAPVFMFMLNSIDLSLFEWPRYKDQYMEEGYEDDYIYEEAPLDEDGEPEWETQPLIGYVHPNRYIPPSKRRRTVALVADEDDDSKVKGEDECRNNENTHEHSECEHMHTNAETCSHNEE